MAKAKNNKNGKGANKGSGKSDKPTGMRQGLAGTFDLLEEYVTTSKA